MVIYEPHSFLVSLTANYQGKTYEWSYDNYEGRTKIDDSLAKARKVKEEKRKAKQEEVNKQADEILQDLTIIKN